MNKRGYSASRERISLDDDLRAAFRKRRKAWAFFSEQPPGYSQLAEHWVMSAKREDTRRRRLDTVIEASARGERAF